MLADGNGDYAKALGLEMDAKGFGMGIRGQRFAIVVDNGVVKSLFVEARASSRSPAQSTCSASSERRAAQPSRCSTSRAAA